jgi:diguanylate cyclase (GGDEF)-like protein
MANDKLTDEPGRLAALKRYDVLDSPHESSFETITNLVRSVLDVPISAISLVDERRQWFKSCSGLEGQQTPRNIAFCDYTIRDVEPMVVPDASVDERFRDNPLVTGDPGIASYAGVPLRTPDGYHIGALCAIDTRPRQFDSAQMEVLKNLAALVVEQLELRNIAERDFLTGALTRRAFIADIDRAIALFNRHRRSAALVMFDIDHFKQINDTHGHGIGDRVIAAIANLCSELMRPSDSIGRLGGEEFAILLRETSEAEAVLAARRYCAAISEMVVDNNPPLKLTASFGVAALATDRLDSAAWLSAADAALYEAKRKGRNRVDVAPVLITKAA